MFKCEGFLEFLNFFPEKWSFKDLPKLFSADGCQTYDLAGCIRTFMIYDVNVDLWYHYDSNQFWFEDQTNYYQSDDFSITELKNIIKLSKSSNLEELKNFI